MWLVGATGWARARSDGQHAVEGGQRRGWKRCALRAPGVWHMRQSAVQDEVTAGVELVRPLRQLMARAECRRLRASDADSVAPAPEMLLVTERSWRSDSSLMR
nr:hypothetical protein CFP56_33633 [Quercus suber]